VGASCEPQQALVETFQASLLPLGLLPKLPGLFQIDGEQVDLFILFSLCHKGFGTQAEVLV
jgi:hypothetical protein